MEEKQITYEMLRKNNIVSITPVGNINEVNDNNIVKPDSIEVQYTTGESKIISGEANITNFLSSIYENR